MKTHLLNTVLIVTLLFGSFTLYGQEQSESKTNNYVVMTTKIPQLSPIILTAEALKKEDSPAFGRFIVIVCGKNSGELTDKDKMYPFIRKAEKADVEIVACGFSLHKFKVDTTKLPKAIRTVENGILYNFQLQKQGYKSISL